MSGLIYRRKRLYHQKKEATYNPRIGFSTGVRRSPDGEMTVFEGINRTYDAICQSNEADA
jgi:hypothetical protein